MNIFISDYHEGELSEVYGKTEWQIYVIIKSPWIIITALKCAIKHWIAAINESLQRRAEYILKKLLDAVVHALGIFIQNLSKLCKTTIAI